MKRSLSLFLAAVLVLCSFTSCTVFNNKNTQTTAEITTAVSTTELTTLPVTESVPETVTETTTEPTTEATTTPEQAAAAGALKVHFINVGAADAILIKCGKEYMLIDGGETETADEVVSYLKKRKVTKLKYIVSTHAHEDHVGGLAEVVKNFDFGKIYAPVTEAETDAYKNFKAAVAEKKSKITHPKCGSSFTLGEAKITVVGPVTENTDNVNNTSIVLYLKYGDVSFLFAGDASLEEEYGMCMSGAQLDCDVLKVAHHGSQTSTGYRFVRASSPEYAIISTKQDSSFMHPAESTLMRLFSEGATIYRTDVNGNIVASTDGKTIVFSTQRNTGANTWQAYVDSAGDNIEPIAGESEEAQVYIGNVNSRALHVPTCENLPADSNRVYFTSIEAAKSRGYKPCKYCMGTAKK